METSTNSPNAPNLPDPQNGSETRIRGLFESLETARFLPFLFGAWFINASLLGLVVAATEVFLPDDRVLLEKNVKEYLVIFVLGFSLLVTLLIAFLREALRDKKTTRWLLTWIEPLLLVAVLFFYAYLVLVGPPGRPIPPGPPTPSPVTPVPTPQMPEISDELLEEIMSTVDARGYITQDELFALGLSPLQYQQIQNLIGPFITKDEVVETINIELTQVAIEEIAYDLLTREATCFVEPLATYSSVAIRRLPEFPRGAIIDYLVKGERIKVVGHDGNPVNSGRWWRVELQRADGFDYGWVNSAAVKEVQEEICNVLSAKGY